MKYTQQNTLVNSSNLSFTSHKAAVNLTPSSRQFFKSLLLRKIESQSEDASNTVEKTVNDEKIVGIMLKYQQSLTGQPRMVFTFEFVRKEDITENDEGVSLELQSDGITPKPHDQSKGDGLPKLYIHHLSFMKVLGATIDLRQDGFTPFLIDREGNEMDPNNT